MSNQERKPRGDSFSDSHECIILDAASKELKEIFGHDDVSSIVVSSILSNNDYQKDAFQVTNETFAGNSKVNRPNVEGMTIEHSSDITIGNKTFIGVPVTINVYHNNDNSIEQEAIYDNEPILEDYREINTPTSAISSDVNKIYWFRKKQNIALLIAAVCLVVATYFTNSFITHAQRNEKQQNDTDHVKLTTPMFPVITRSEWQAQNPISPLIDLLQLPSKILIIAHTATSTCSTQASCSSKLQSMQAYHFQLGWNDIGYNFLVGGDGSAYIGRGWDKEGAHSRHFNSISICIAFIGEFIETIPPQEQITAAQKLIEEGLLYGKLAFDYRLYGHLQVMSTASPGDALYAIIKEWDHWSDILI